MEISNNDKKVTASGSSDLPEPAGEELKTGLPRPLASYCLISTEQTDNELATIKDNDIMDEIITNETEEDNPFRRRDSLRRTPPMRLNRSVSLELGTSNSYADVFEMSACKKRKAGSPPDSAEGAQINPAMQKLRNKIELLVNFSKKNKTVHKDIKVWANDLQALVRQATRSITSGDGEDAIKLKTLKDKLEEQKDEFEKYKTEQEKKFEQYKLEMENKVKEMTKVNKNAVCQICKEKEENNTYVLPINGIANYKDLEEVINLKWQRENFTNSEMTTEDPLNVINEDLIIFCDKDIKRRSRLCKTLINRHPEINLAIETMCGENYFVEIVQSIDFKNSIGLNQNMKRKIITAFIDPTKQEDKLARDLFDMMNKLKEVWDNESDYATKVVVAPPSIKSTYLQKLMETVFHGTKTHLRVIPTRRKDKPKNEKSKRSDTLLVKMGEGNSYAETLKKLKEGLKDNEITNNIKEVKKTNKGELLIRVVNEKDKVHDCITNVLPGQEISTNREKSVILHIRDIDETASEHEIIESITKNINLTKPESLKIKSLRPNVSGRQIATVSIDSKDEKLISDNIKIRIGLNSCRVEKRIELQKCFKCWNYDHISKTCKGDDRSKACRKCGEAGHIATDCKNPPACPICSVEGHMAGSGRCPKFRAALKNQRSKTVINKTVI